MPSAQKRTRERQIKFVLNFHSLLISNAPCPTTSLSAGQSPRYLFLDGQTSMLQSSRVPFMRELHCTARNKFTVISERQGKIHYGSVEKFVKYQEKCTTRSYQYTECSCNLSFHYVTLLKKMRKHPCQLPLYKEIKEIKHITQVTEAENPIAAPISTILGVSEGRV